MKRIVLISIIVFISSQCLLGQNLTSDVYQDEYIYFAGFTLPQHYYYNITGRESLDTLVEYLDKNKQITSNLPKNLLEVVFLQTCLISIRYLLYLLCNIYLIMESLFLL